VLIDLFLAFNDCSELLTYVSKLGLDVAGIRSDVLELCLDQLPQLQRSVAIVPRCIHESTQRSLLPPRRELRRCLPLCIPSDLQTARSLAKVSQSVVIALNVETLKFVDETQVNFMATSKVRKFIEVLLEPFIELARIDSKRMSLERALHFVGETIERCLKLDVGIFVSSYSPSIKRVLHPIHIDVLLQSLGFTKRERRLVLQVYPLEALRSWLGEEGWIRLR